MELTSSIPDHLRPRLLWDKRILRDAVGSRVPQRIAERHKVPFFYGSGTHHAYGMLVRLMNGNGQELVERAVTAPGADAYLDAGKIRRRLSGFADGMSDSPSVELLTRIINMGLLAEMATSAPRLESMDAGAVRSELRVKSDPVADTQQLFAPRRSHDLDGVPVSAKGLLLLSHASGDWYLANDGQIEFVLWRPTSASTVSAHAGLPPLPDFFNGSVSVTASCRRVSGPVPVPSAAGAGRRGRLRPTGGALGGRTRAGQWRGVADRGERAGRAAEYELVLGQLRRAEHEMDGGGSAARRGDVGLGAEGQPRRRGVEAELQPGDAGVAGVGGEERRQGRGRECGPGLRRFHAGHRPVLDREDQRIVGERGELLVPLLPQAGHGSVPVHHRTSLDGDPAVHHGTGQPLATDRRGLRDSRLEGAGGRSLAAEAGAGHRGQRAGERVRQDQTGRLGQRAGQRLGGPPDGRRVALLE
ncbi:asparagine synthase-related protein [Streptomyces sp. NPDC006872]|uniref:asparagine synthase-related protein n=1 Tax=Streptomyces sp. NPDC006872 TaxID=3155720 RepID=UPI0034001DD2